jgi:hypothetical protein
MGVVAFCPYEKERTYAQTGILRRGLIMLLRRLSRLLPESIRLSNSPPCSSSFCCTPPNPLLSHVNDSRAHSQLRTHLDGKRLFHGHMALVCSGKP